jgi:hypothetical protein
MAQSLAPMDVIDIPAVVSDALSRLGAKIVGLSGRTLWLRVDENTPPQFGDVTAVLRDDPMLWEQFDDISMI